jgi:hypothetical protein
VQLLGQAVQFYRGRQRDQLCIALDEGNARGKDFFAQYGFHETEELTAAGRVWTKDIRLPEL